MVILNAAFLPPGYPQSFREARDCRIVDVDGNEYIDFICSSGPIVPWDLIGVTPDLSVWSKAIANGYPIATLLGRDTLREAVTTIYTTGRGGEPRA